MKIVAGMGDVDSAAPSYALWAMSRKVRSSDALTAIFDGGADGVLAALDASDDPAAADLRADFDAFVHEFGSRGPNEWEISAETWETNPVMALTMLDSVRRQDDDQAPERRAAKLTAEREALVGQVRGQLAEIGNEELIGMFEGAVVASNFMVYRERAKTNIIKTVHEGRMCFRELGRRHADAGNLAHPFHIFMLVADELDGFVADPGSFKDTLAQRHADWLLLDELVPPFIIADGNVPPLSEWDRKGGDAVAAAAPGTVLSGVAGCPGTVRGIARIIMDPGDPGALEPGDIMVAPNTDPGWTPLFMTAGGVVVNVGGQISHSIIVSRELGLPCVVSVENATSLIPDGALIEVDGDTGQVTIVAEG